MKFFFDRNIAARLARMLDQFDDVHTIRHHDDDGRFTPTTPDIEWLTALGHDDPSWVVVSADGRILRNALERQALDQANLKFVLFAPAWTRMKVHEWAWRIVRVWPEVTETVTHVRGRIFEMAGGRSYKVRRLE